ncbi:arrestin domain-containing protein 3-like [Stomoxys calcitrans]|uniref:arrestin domain-containing protein 3-like n=1 Tax=Stomoxys calcitrans TaxID=35570 RepID=UPI0027E2EFE2|nr:arrestin domain-containing protein 3-like [Stomoxys calcitrans]
MPSAFLFELDHPNGVYYSGQTINGIIKLTTTQEKQVRNVRIVLLGQGKAKWDESYTSTDSRGNNTTTVIYYRSDEVYVNNETLVRGEGMLPVGLHTYTFSVTLPAQCPTSCKGTYGHIRYGISLILNRVLRFDNVYHIPLTVLQTVDLNLNPVFKVPLLTEDNASVGCWPCAGGDIKYSLRTPFGAYTPGQVVKYALDIQNQSMASSKGYEMQFIQKMTFTATTPRRAQRQTKITLIKQESSENCLRLTNRIFEKEFRIPPVSPTTDASFVIHVEYKLKITIFMSGCHKSRHISLPIFIGNIPLRESLKISESVLPTASEMQIPSPVASSPELPSSYYDIKPPSYAAALQSGSPFVDDDVDKHHRVVGFRPLYPMYS